MQLCSVLHEHAFEQLDRQAMHNDMLVGQLGRELENGRLLRLASRLAMVCERSTEEDLEAQWSETGKQPSSLWLWSACSHCEQPGLLLNAALFAKVWAAV